MKKFRNSIIAMVLAVSLLFSTTACNQADTLKVVNLVVAEIPTAIQLVQIVLQITNNMAVVNGVDQATLTDINSVGKDVQSSLTELQTLGQAYTAKPDAKTFEKIVAVVDKIVTETDGSLLNVAHIKSQDSREKAQVAIASLDTVLHLIDGYLLSKETPAQIQAKVQARQIKLQAIKDKLNKAYIDEKAKPFGTSFDQMVTYETSLGL